MVNHTSWARIVGRGGTTAEKMDRLFVIQRSDEDRRPECPQQTVAAEPRSPTLCPMTNGVRHLTDDMLIYLRFKSRPVVGMFLLLVIPVLGWGVELPRSVSIAFKM
jgi:hypothetical protein